MGRPSRVKSAIGCVYEAALDSAGWATALFAIAMQNFASVPARANRTAWLQ